MKIFNSLIFLSLVTLWVPFKSGHTVQSEENNAIAKPRIINTTDLGADPDDEQSLVRQLVAANEFDIEGLVVATSCWKKSQNNTATGFCRL